MSKSKSGKMTDDGKPELKPKLRFPEFRDAGEWDSKPLGEFATIHKGKGVSKSDLAPDGKLSCIRYAELYTHYGEVIEAVRSRTNVSRDELVLSNKGDVIIPASGETKEDIATASCVMYDNVALGSDLNIVRSELYGPFFSYYLNGSKRFEIAKVAQGVTVAHLYPGQLEKIEVAYPEPDEQQKIADCLSSLDELIAAHSRKLDALKAHKKGLMQQLFPREGKTLPRLRFPEFKDAPEWEILTIGELFSLINGRAFKPEDWQTSGTPIIRIQNLNDPSAVFNYSQEPVPERNRVEPGDLLFAWSGTLGSSFGARIWNGPAGVLNQHIFKVLMDEQRIISQFAVLVLARVEEEIARRTHGFKASFVHVKKSDLVKVEMLLPSVPEQQHIATCLSSLDALIAAETQKVKAFKMHKKGLMQQLFPSLES